MHPALDIDLFATSAVPHAAEPVTELSRDQVPEMAPVAGQIQSSPAPAITGDIPSGSCLPPSGAMDLSGAGEARFVFDAARSSAIEGILALPPIVPQVDADPLPAFLANPSWGYLDAIERGAA